MTKLLWISYCAPYDKVAHAGGKNHYYWLKTINEDSDFEINLITCCKKDEVTMIENMNYDFQYWCYVAPVSVWGKMKQKVISFINVWDFISKYASSIAIYKINSIKKHVKDLQRSGYYPDTILLQWTQIGFLYKWIKKIYPNAKIVIMEEDVSFLRTQREKDNVQGAKRIWKSLIHSIMYKRELDMCNFADGVIVNNLKDKNILVDYGIAESKIIHAIPYYDRMYDVVPNNCSKNILFYGAMNRNENIDAVKWFATEVFPELIKEDDYKFIILGGNPSKDIISLQDENIVVTGFVEDIRPYFSDVFCMAVPLFSGAGIKIKVLEGMSAGIPVLTNTIGIEGIFAENGKQYCHCETKQDYIEWIEKLASDKKLASSIGEEGRRLMQAKFDPANSIDGFKKMIG